MSWSQGVRAITVFVDDLEVSRGFYREVFDLPVIFEDDDSTAYDAGNTIINLLKIAAAPELILPAAVGTASNSGGGSRFVTTIDVADVDEVSNELTKRGVELLNGPMDRPWGLRTASFTDPDGNIWEIATPL
jgi:catechol 2,3-dioxygenase-like lactoylglutathione lyase family enzyme